MANVWKDPIFDRTLEDVNNALYKISNWKQHHTHSVDVKVEKSTLVWEDGVTAYPTDNKLIVNSEGATYIDEDVLILDIDDVYDLRGCLNLADLNRIEGNIAYLADKMEEFFFHPNIHNKSWSNGGLPNQDDLSRIMNNIRSLTNSFYSPSNAPVLPSTMLSYDDINAIEENLYLIKELLDCLESSFKKSGTINSGSTTFLPIRR